MAGPPSGRRNLWQQLTHWYAWLLSQLLVATIAILIIPVTLQIFSRYTHLIPSYIWTEEMARFLFVWSIMLGAMIGVRETTHFEVDVFSPNMPPRRAAMLRIFSRLCVLAIALMFVWGGIEFTRFGWNRISELAELPLWTIHIAWPVAGVSCLIFLGEQLWNDVAFLMGWRKTPVEPPSTAEVEAETGGHE